MDTGKVTYAPAWVQDATRLSVIRTGRDLLRHGERIDPGPDRPDPGLAQADLNAPQNDFGHPVAEWHFSGMQPPICGPKGSARASRTARPTSTLSDPLRRTAPPARVIWQPVFAVEYLPTGWDPLGPWERVELTRPKGEAPVPISDLLVVTKPLTVTSAPAAEPFLALLPWLLEAARCVLVPIWAVPDWAA